jgi:hypothetical protein
MATRRIPRPDVPTVLMDTKLFLPWRDHPEQCDEAYNLVVTLPVLILSFGGNVVPGVVPGWPDIRR